jgi:hypothetical protein
MKLTIYILTIIAATTLTSCATKKPKVMQTYTVTVNGKEYQYTGDTMINGVRISHSDNAVIWDKNEVDSGTEVLSDTATLIGEPVVEHSEIKDTGKLTVVDGGHWCKPYCKHISTRREGWSGPMKLPNIITFECAHIWTTIAEDTRDTVVVDNSPRIIHAILTCPPVFAKGAELICVLCHKHKTQVIHNKNPRSIHELLQVTSIDTMLMQTIDTGHPHLIADSLQRATAQ